MNLLLSNLMGRGVPPELAGLLGLTIQSAKTATGSAQGDAYALTTTVTEFTTTAASTGARLPAADPGLVFAVANFGAESLTLYPATGDKINNGSANAGITVAANKAAFVVAIDTTDWIGVVTG